MLTINYKFIVLNCTLLASSAIFSMIDPKLQELLDKSRQKQECLAQLDTKLIKQKQLLFSTAEEGTALRQQYISLVKAELMQEQTSPEVIESTIKETISKIEEKVKEARTNFFKEVVNRDAERATFNAIEQELHGDYKDKWLALMKFDVIHHEMALSVLSNLMKDWQNCLTEIMEIDKEIAQLENSKSISQ